MCARPRQNSVHDEYLWDARHPRCQLLQRLPHLLTVSYNDTLIGTGAGDHLRHLSDSPYCSFRSSISLELAVESDYLDLKSRKGQVTASVSPLSAARMINV